MTDTSTPKLTRLHPSVPRITIERPVFFSMGLIWENVSMCQNVSAGLPTVVGREAFSTTGQPADMPDVEDVGNSLNVEKGSHAPTSSSAPRPRQQRSQRPCLPFAKRYHCPNFQSESACSSDSQSGAPPAPASDSERFPTRGRS